MKMENDERKREIKNWKRRLKYSRYSKNEINMLIGLSVRGLEVDIDGPWGSPAGWTVRTLDRPFGDMREESVRELELVMEDIFLYYKEKGKELPKPGKIHIVSGSLCDYFSGDKERLRGLTKND